MIPLRMFATTAMLALSSPAFADCADELATLEGTGASDTTVAQAAMPGADPSVEQDSEQSSIDEAQAESDATQETTGDVSARADEVPQAVMPGADPSVQQEAEASAESTAEGEASSQETAMTEAREHLAAGRESECLAAVERAKVAAR